MKANDTITGGIFLAIAIFTFVYAGTFSSLPGVKYGPDLFPRLISILMGLGGIALIVGSARRTGGLPLFTLAPWARRPRNHAILASVVASIVFYILGSERLGFLLSGFLMLGGLLAVTRGTSKLLSSAVVAAGVTVILYLIFARLLRVPLPMGAIELMMVR
ncbi:MAG: tripartite tricarboxylate transporter TctB family protein [Mesorhizobium sp.]|nr:tripartite tricarboxylate transporter TctB family protein [Mesorhizobium sp.]MCO5160199.1 tripartite tricarboxylate transporter TctB family protein [Mesorhizobium sp.]